MIVETDQPVPPDAISWLQRVEGVIKVTYLNVRDAEARS